MPNLLDDDGAGRGEEMAFLQPLFDRLEAWDNNGGGLPFVTLSYAQSVDGSIAARPSQPFALSSEKSFAMTLGTRLFCRFLLDRT